jgi:hypothetical protein
MKTKHVRKKNNKTIKKGGIPSRSANPSRRVNPSRSANPSRRVNPYRSSKPYASRKIMAEYFTKVSSVKKSNVQIKQLDEYNSEYFIFTSYGIEKIGIYTKKSINNGIMKYANGDIYEGEWKDRNPNGTGIMKYANGDIYEGEWKDGNPNGDYEIKYRNGDSYKGSIAVIDRKFTNVARKVGNAGIKVTGQKFSQLEMPREMPREMPQPGKGIYTFNNGLSIYSDFSKITEISCPHIFYNIDHKYYYITEKESIFYRMDTDTHKDKDTNILNNNKIYDDITEKKENPCVYYNDYVLDCIVCFEPKKWFIVCIHKDDPEWFAITQTTIGDKEIIIPHQMCAECYSNYVKNPIYDIENPTCYDGPETYGKTNDLFTINDNNKDFFRISLDTDKVDELIKKADNKDKNVLSK